jgi:pilus assembly protein CpaF
MADLIQLTLLAPPAPPRHIPLSPGIYSIGSDERNRIPLPSPGVTGRHAILTVNPRECWIEDLESDQGTRLEGRPVRGRAAWKSGQALTIGPFTLSWSNAQPVITPPTPPPAPTPPPTPTPAPDPHRELRIRIKQTIHRELLERLDIKRMSAAHIGHDELSRRTLKALQDILHDSEGRLPPEVTPAQLIREIHDEALGLGPLEDLLADASVTEIMVNGPSQIFIERAGRIELTERTFLDNDSVLAIIERIVSPLGRRIDESQPYVDARLKDGSRVNAVIPPLSLVGPCLTIRKFAQIPLRDEDLIRFGTWTREMADFLHACILLRKNIIVAGGTGSGKTTLLNVLSEYLPSTDRILTIEDAAELRLKQPHVIRLEARPPNLEGKGAVTIRDLVRNSLRMRPDRIIVGECRGGEALDMLQAMNTGHDGSLTTIHANSPRDVLSRLETLVLMSGMDLPVRAIREQIASAIDLIIHESRLGDGSRKIVSVTEIVGQEGDRITMQELFKFEQSGVMPDGRVLGFFTSTGTVPTFMEQFHTRNLKVDQAIFDPLYWAQFKEVSP